MREALIASRSGAFLTGNGSPLRAAVRFVLRRTVKGEVLAAVFCFSVFKREALIMKPRIGADDDVRLLCRKKRKKMSFTEECLSTYAVRKTAKEKEEFRTFLTESLQKEGISCQIQGNKRWKNVLAGDFDRPRVLFTAHYDTAARNLFRIPSVVGGGAVRRFFRLIRESIASLFVSRKPSPASANDNTSGVCCLYRLAGLMNGKTGAAFAFTDGEECGMKGVRLLKKQYKALAGIPVVVLDCVGNGDRFGVLYYRRQNRRLADRLSQKLEREEFYAFSHKAGETFSTEAEEFPRGVSIAAFFKKGKVYSFPDIHTAHDTAIRMRNFEYLAKRLAAFDFTGAGGDREEAGK